MAGRLNWIEVLHDESDWKGDSDIEKWFVDVLGRPVSYDAQALKEFKNALTFIRTQLSHLHFGAALDLDALDKRLRGLTLGIISDERLKGCKKTRLPLLRVRADGDSDSHVLKSLASTLLVQFAEFLTQAAEGNAPIAIARCEGLYKDARATTVSPVPSISPESELKWRRELSVLAENDLEDAPEILRCADVFVATPKGKFCSDSCRFTTFQLTKQIKDPQYLADKQRRYRNRKEQ